MKSFTNWWSNLSKVQLLEGIKKFNISKSCGIDFTQKLSVEVCQLIMSELDTESLHNASLASMNWLSICKSTPSFRHRIRRYVTLRRFEEKYHSPPFSRADLLLFLCIFLILWEINVSYTFIFQIFCFIIDLVLISLFILLLLKSLISTVSDRRILDFFEPLWKASI